MEQVDNDIVNMLVHKYGLENILFEIADILDKAVIESIEYKKISHELNISDIWLHDEAIIRVIWDFAIILYGIPWYECIYRDQYKDAAEWFRYLAKEE